jgi:hypothetical protein
MLRVELAEEATRHLEIDKELGKRKVSLSYCNFTTKLAHQENDTSGEQNLRRNVDA